MQAFLRIDLPDKLPVNFIKISPIIYWDKESNIFYKSAIFPSHTLLSDDKLLTRNNMVFTKYNPNFLAMKCLFLKK